MARTEGVEATFTPIPKVLRKPKRSPADEVNEAERAAKKSRTTAVPQAPEISRLTTTPPATAQQPPGGTLATTRVAPPPNMYTGDYLPTEYPYRSQIPVQVSNSQVHAAYSWRLKVWKQRLFFAPSAATDTCRTRRKLVEQSQCCV